MAPRIKQAADAAWPLSEIDAALTAAVARKNEPAWAVARARGHRTHLNGDIDGAMRLWREAAALALAKADVSSARTLLTEAQQDATARGDFEAALGLARGAFVFAQNEWDLTQAVDRAGRALIGMGAGAEPLAAWLGLVGASDVAVDSPAGATMRQWLSARPPAAWNEALAAALAKYGDEDQVDPAA